MGASASGKSSLVNAGLLPALLGGFSPRVGSHWRIAAFRPGANPIHNLARALAAPEVLATDDSDPVNAAAQVEATLRRSGFGLADAVRQGGTLDGGRVLVVVDQFEELFRFHANGAEQTISTGCLAVRAAPHRGDAGRRGARRRGRHDALGLPR